MRRLSIIAADFDSACLSFCKKVTSRCTQFATASVMIMVGELAEGGVSSIRSQPAMPIAVTIDSTITSSVASVPHTERIRMAITSMMMTNMIGTSVCMSLIAISENALFRKTMPVRCISRSGNRSVSWLARFREKLTTSGTSTAGSTPGNWMMTLTAVTCPLGETIRLTSRGSLTAISRIFSSSPGPSSFACMTRSSTISSSPSARVYWKFVTESTRIE